MASQNAGKAKNRLKARRGGPADANARRAYSRASSSQAKRQQAAHAPARPRRKPNPEINVKKATYSRAARDSVLASAGARQLLIDTGGENTIDVIRDFERDMSDEEIAKKTGIKASDVRVVLNRLHSRGLFSYTRVRDRDSGWYSYIWRMDEARLREFVGMGAEKEAGEKTVEIEGDAYRCAACSPGELVCFGDAADAEFRCLKCGSGLEFFERRRR